MRDARVGPLGGIVPACLAAFLVAGSPAPATASPGQSGRPPSEAQDEPSGARRDFLFGRPIGWVGVRAGWLVPSAGGDLFAFIGDQLTIEKGDFRGAAISAELGFALMPRLDVAAGVEGGSRTVTSEYRRFVDNRGLPISQTTTLTQIGVYGTVRVALLERGRSVSRFAYVPGGFTPYLGAGGGLHHYRFGQHGDFVDFVTLRVFDDVFASRGWGPSAHLFGGADVRMWRSLYLTVDARRVWAHGDLGADFVGFDGIDLSGFRVSSGVSLFFS